MIRREVLKNPNISCNEISKYIKIQYNKDISKSTSWRILNEFDFKSFDPKNRPFLSKIHIQKRLDFSKEFFCKPVEYWMNVFWSDECTFELFSSNIQRKY